jgi:DNA-directed RNA polymerase specialized sigma24 family protein
MDPLLVPFVAAATQAEANDTLGRLLHLEAEPVIARVLRAKLGSKTAEAADLTSAARAELIARLLALRRGEDAPAISNFRGYVAAVAYNVWAQHLRLERPARAMLLNRLRYLLENRTARHGFGMWDGTAGERWCGFEQWRTASVTDVSIERAHRLAANPMTAAREALGLQDWSGMNLADLVARLFTWLGGPIELRKLAGVLSELLEISDEKASFEDETSGAMAHPGPSPDDELKWQDYLRWLWNELTTLSLPQRSAFLLHSEVTPELDFRGVASVRQIAAALEIAAEEFARLWPSLPLNDLLIAALLHLQRQQVINLRRVARDRLGAAWEKWIN